LRYRMKARTQEIDGLREKRVWFQRKESLVSKKGESEIEIWNEGEDPRDVTMEIMKMMNLYLDGCEGGHDGG
jgi:hypothetical protein